MSTNTEERILSSLSNLEIFFDNNPEAQQYIDSLITENFHEESLGDAFDAIKDIYGEKISKDISLLLSFSRKSLGIINSNIETYKFGKYYKLLLHKFRRKFIRLRNLEENGVSTLVNITDSFEVNALNYVAQRADKSYVEFKMTHDSQLSVIEYFINAFSRYVSWSTNLDQDDLEGFVEDSNEIKKALDELESIIQNKIEEIENDRSEN